MRAVQDAADRELPAPRLHHQPPIAPPRDPGRGPSRPGRRRPLAPRRSPQSEHDPASPAPIRSAATAAAEHQQRWSLGQANRRAADGRSGSCCGPAWWAPIEQRQASQRCLALLARLCGQAPEGWGLAGSRSALPVSIPQCLCLKQQEPPSQMAYNSATSSTKSPCSA